MAGEIYTTFTFLGGSGWAYGQGGPAFYILSYGCLAYILSYWMLPAIWRYAKEHRPCRKLCRTSTSGSSRCSPTRR